MNTDHGEIIIYQSEDGKANLDVHLHDETVWLTQKQISSLFETERSVVTKHINNVFKTGKLDKKAVCANFAHTAADGKKYQTTFYNLDVIISVGYRVNAKRGTQFRIWATSVLKDHLVKGYSIHRKRLAEKGIDELQQIVALLSKTLKSQELVNGEGRALLDIVNRYAETWKLLLQYDENNLPAPKPGHELRAGFDLSKMRIAIEAFKKELTDRGEATNLFGQERGKGMARIIGAIQG